MNDLLQIATLSLVSISCALVGPFLVLRRMTMFANSLSHTILLGIVLAFLITGSVFTLSSLLIGALLAALMSAFLTEGLVKLFRLQEDASIGLVFTTLFALGIILVTLYTRNVHLGLESVMGNVDLLQLSDLKLSAILAGFNLLTITLFFRQFQLSSFDSNLAKTLKLPHHFFHFLLLFLTSITCIGAFRSVGVLLVLAFLVGPFLTARVFCHRLSKLLVLSCVFGVLASVFGVFSSRILFDQAGLALSTGGIVTIWLGLFYLFSKWIDALKSRHAKKNCPSRQYGLNRGEHSSGCTPSQQ